MKIAHAILGGAVAAVQGNSALAGAGGAAGGEAIADVIRNTLYNGRPAKDLTEEEKQNISNLAQLAAGLATAAAGGSTSDAATAASASKNSVENNSMFVDYIRDQHKGSVEYWKDKVRETVGENTISQITNGVLNAYGGTVDFTAGAADTVVDAVLALGSCTMGAAYCDTAINDLKGSNKTASDAVEALASGQAWDSLLSTVKKAQQGDQKALEDVAGILTGILTPAKIVAGNTGKVGNAVNKVENTIANESKVASQAEKELVDAGKGTTTVKTPDGISFNIDQPAHLSAVEKYTQQKGITGGHNADAFYSAANQNGVKIVSETPTGIPGVTEIKYQIPAKDRAGNIIGYKDKPLTKTIYDPKIVSDQKILDLGQQAAASGYKSAITSGAREYTSSAGGISFRVYLDPKTGTVTNFFPVTK